MTKENILQALKQIIDPDFNKDIVSLGFVKDIKIQGNKVSVEISLTTPACPVKADFQKQAQDLLGRLEGVREVEVKMTDQARPHSAAVGNIPTTLTAVKTIVAVSSCKGGVGKSTMAAHMSQELARRGFKVGLVDVDIHGPSLPTLFHLPQVSVGVNDEQQLIPIEKNRLKLMSFGFLLGDAPAVMRGPMVSRYVQQILHNTAWGELDYLFIDLPPGTGDVQLTITQTVRLSGAVMVTTPQTLSLVDVARGILMFEKVDVPILGVIDNMSYFLCDHCGEKHFIFGKSTKDSLQERFGIEILAEIPLRPDFTQTLDEPLVNDHITAMVDKVVMAIGKTQIRQREIPAMAFDKKEVTLTWQDGTKISVANRDLRLSCRCALCLNEITGDPMLPPQNIRPDIAPKEIFPLGNYALGIHWNDGHSSGIYPYRMIKELAGHVQKY